LPRIDFTSDNKELFGKFESYCKKHEGKTSDYLSLFAIVIEEGRAISSAREIAYQLMIALEAKGLIEITYADGVKLEGLGRIKKGQITFKIFLNLEM
jgi:hypothetical protein